MKYIVQFKNKTNNFPILLEETFDNKDTAHRWADMVKSNGYDFRRIVTVE